MDVLAAQYGRYRGSTGAQTLAHGDYVRHCGQLLSGKPESSAAHSGGDLIPANQEPLPLAPLRQAQPRALGGLWASNEAALNASHRKAETVLGPNS